MAEYDLTQVSACSGRDMRANAPQRLIPHLDRHLAIVILNHLADIEVFPAAQIAKAQ